MTRRRRLHVVMRKPRSSRSTPGSARARHVAELCFAVVVLLGAGVAFIYKMTEFAATIVHGEVEGFGAAAVSVYLIGLLPILLITLWALFTGRFRDIEQPKFRMLELDREIERGGEVGDRHV